MGLISIVTSIAIAVAPLIVYTDQIISIVKSKSSKGFSSFICLILLLSNITRILFWFGNHFEIALLVQSILLIVCMFILQYTCVHYSQSNNKGDTFNLSGDNNSNSNRNLKLSLQSYVRDFWMWGSFKPYVASVGVYTSFMTVLYIFLGSYDWFVGLLGYIALGLEATLPIPQFINNYKQKSLKGFRYTVLLGWLFGDSFKTVYFILNNLPVQFAVCAIFQLAIDVAIGIQGIIYRKNSHTYNQTSSSEY